MKIYKKLNQARELFHQSKLTKTGHNKFAGYHYFELSDFLVPALKIFNDIGLCAMVSFDAEIATMLIVDVENGESIKITSPMSTASLKACHEVQNLGAVQTYLRRYLWVAALEIVEHDAIDSSEGKAPKKLVVTPTGNAKDGLHSDRLAIIQLAASNIVEMFSKSDVVGAYGEYISVEDNDEKTALWTMLSAPVRSAIKKHGESLKGA